MQIIQVKIESVYIGAPMPELPEVETTCRGIAPHLLQQTIQDIIVREPRLRWPVAVSTLKKQLISQPILSITRRAKYIYIQVPTGYLLIHLGMSGTVRIVPKDTAVRKHDHFDCILNNGKMLRFNDPRRFGCLLWAKDPEQLPMISHLGPEPFDNTFNATYLLQKAATRKIAIKSFIMDSKIVVGVGNIYASESLFLAKINPFMSSCQLSAPQATLLCKAIKKTLKKAIQHGGTTLKDFCQSDGKPGYFRNELKVYGREHEACVTCHQPISAALIGQRMSYFCKQCQK